MNKSKFNSNGTGSIAGGNSSNDEVASLASSSDSSTSIQNGRILIASRVAIDEMPSLACSDKQVDSGSFSVPVGGAWVRVALYADDSGSMVFTNAADDSVHAVVRSSLEEGEWPNADNADYFSVVREVFFPQGDYQFVCKVNNIDMAPHNSQNRTYCDHA